MAVKVTRAMIQKYVKTRNDVKLLERELYEMRTSDKGLGNSVILDGSKRYPPVPQTIVGFDSEKYENRRLQMQHKAEQCAAVEKWIEEIEDIQTRQVFEFRYLKELKWEMVSKKMGYTSGDYARITVHDRYLDKIFGKK